MNSGPPATPSARERWGASDPWLLLALIYAREPADAARLREIGDFINHAIFTDKELREGLRRLIAAGYATESGARHAPSPAVLSWYDQATRGKSRTSVSKDLDRAHEFLWKRPPLRKRLASNRKRNQA